MKRESVRAYVHMKGDTPPLYATVPILDDSPHSPNSCVRTSLMTPFSTEKHIKTFVFT